MRVRTLMAALLLVGLTAVAGCGREPDPADEPEPGAASEVQEDPESQEGEEEPEAEESEIPGLPSSLPDVEDPGTIDPILGDFPVSASREIQFAWVDLSDKGRTFTGNLRRTQVSPAEDFFQNYAEADLYYDGVTACVLLSQNFSVNAVVTNRGQTYDTDEVPLSDEQVAEVGSAVASAAVADLCPELSVLIDDPDFLISTATGLRSILGLSEDDFADADANKFANYVCQTLGRGTTQSRLVSDIADTLGYPDDLAEELVEYVDKYACD